MAFGYPPAEIQKARRDFERAALAPDQFDVWPENVTAVRLFLALRTQWRAVGLSTMAAARLIHTGLDYGAIETTARLTRLEMVEGDFSRLQVMEAEAIAAWREEA